jgi:uncharacterized protein (TIGR02186 family)
MSAARALLAAGILALAPAPAKAERLITVLSTHLVLIASNFTGAEIVLFGSIERDAQTVARRGGYDIVVTVIGPRQNVVTWRKERIAGIWVNAEARPFIEVPSYLAVLANREIDRIADRATLDRTQTGLERNMYRQEVAGDVADVIREDPFRQAFLRLQKERRLYRERTDAVTLLTPTLFRTAIPVPDNAPTGTYNVQVRLFADGALLATTTTALEVQKVAFEQFVAAAAREHAVLYGLVTVALALTTGWLASVVFRRD